MSHKRNTPLYLNSGGVVVKEWRTSQRQVEVNGVEVGLCKSDNQNTGDSSRERTVLTPMRPLVLWGHARSDWLRWQMWTPSVCWLSWRQEISVSDLTFPKVHRWGLALMLGGRGWLPLGIPLHPKECWMGLRSGLCAGQPSSSTSNWENHLWTLLCTGTGAVSYWKIKRDITKLLPQSLKHIIVLGITVWCSNEISFNWNKGFWSKQPMKNKPNQKYTKGGHSLSTYFWPYSVLKVLDWA